MTHFEINYPCKQNFPLNPIAIQEKQLRYQRHLIYSFSFPVGGSTILFPPGCFFLLFYKENTEKNNNAKCYWTINNFITQRTWTYLLICLLFHKLSPPRHQNYLESLAVWKQTLVAMPTGLPTAWQQFASSWGGLTFAGIDLQQSMSKQCFINTRHELIPQYQKIQRSFNGCRPLWPTSQTNKALEYTCIVILFSDAI